MERIGPYRVVRRLGSGGMGVVLEAVDDGLQRTVALKVLAAHLAEDPVFRTRFTREAQALAALDSPHVVQVHAHGEDDGRLWIATQYLPDGDLGALLESSGALPPRVAVDVVAQVASGLADAHAAGLVHRDIKPANVFLRRRGSALTAFLGDFGIARGLLDDRTRTRAGTLGTPSYMAPELHTGGTAGVASDVYALGCLLWAALTGGPPYVGSSGYEVVRAHVERPVPRLTGTSPMVVELNRILARAMAKDPAARYASAHDLRYALRSAETLSVEPAPVRRRWLLVAGAAAVLLAAVGGAVVVVLDDDAPSASTSTPDRPDREAAVATLTETLVATSVMNEAQAACTAERWIEGAGLEAMREAGLFDEQWRYVDRDASTLTPAIERAAREAAIACATAD